MRFDCCLSQSTSDRVNGLLTTENSTFEFGEALESVTKIISPEIFEGCSMLLSYHSQRFRPKRDLARITALGESRHGDDEPPLVSMCPFKLAKVPPRPTWSSTRT